MLTEIKQIKKLQKKPDGIFGSFMTRPFSHVIAFFSYKLKLSPNFISFLSFLFCIFSIVLIYQNSYKYYVIGAIFWWVAAIFDAADGDLARYSGLASPFGGWLDSLFDRIKEFIIFAILGYICYSNYHNEIYLLLGIISIFTNVMSGWISDTKKLFIQKREVEITLSKNYSLGMVDTRDFIIILSLFINELRLALIIYGLGFPFVVLSQIILFYKRYGRSNNISKEN